MPGAPNVVSTSATASWRWSKGLRSEWCLTCGSEHNYRAPKTRKATGVVVRNRTEQPKKAKAPTAGRASREPSQDGARTLRRLGVAYARTSSRRFHALLDGELLRRGAAHPAPQVRRGLRRAGARRRQDQHHSFRDGAKTLAHRVRSRSRGLPLRTRSRIALPSAARAGLALRPLATHQLSSLRTRRLAARFGASLRPLTTRRLAARDEHPLPHLEQALPRAG